jgi:hypothetical protein
MGGATYPSGVSFLAALWFLWRVGVSVCFFSGFGGLGHIGTTELSRGRGEEAMRRFWILFVVVAMALAIAGPATGKKPEGRPPIAVYVENGPWWVHEAGDVIVYAVHVENKTRTTPIEVTVSTDFGAVPVVQEIEGATTEVVVFERTVLAAEVPPYGTSGEIVGTVTVSYQVNELVNIVLEEGTVVERYNDCGIGNDGGTATVDTTDGTACIWHTDQRGAWTISVLPVDPKVSGMSVTLRDHVPGNWCTPDGSGGGAYVRWHPKDATRDPLTLNVFLPDPEDKLPGGDPLGDGVCYGGGAGGATMQDGSHDSFYLWLRHDAVVTISPTS